MSPEDTKRLQEATQDLGFGRPTSSPAAPPAVSVVERQTRAPDAVNASPASKAQPAKPRVSKPANPTQNPNEAPGFKDAALKITVPDDLWNTLRMEAIKRRVTVKFLVLEALAAKGYDVDLDAIPEDGRRLR